ncbi:MAG: alpha/beta hydrolase fold domain-containing protein [Gammaproteobacteria bacterium]
MASIRVNRARARLLDGLQWSLALLALCVGLLATVHVPHRALWVPSLIAKEWGHLIALWPMLLLFWCLRGRKSWSAAVLATCAAGLLLDPLTSALRIANELPLAMKRAFGTPPLPSPFQVRAKPLMFSDLAHFSVPEVSPRTVSFKPGLALDLYRLADSRPLPVVVVIHGGSWHSGDSGQIPAINRYLAQRGYAVAAVNYRKAPENPFPAARDDVIAAIHFLKAHAGILGIDPRRLVLLGRSAGGHLALVVAYGVRDPAIRGVISLYAPTDLVWSWKHPGNPRVLDTHRLLRNFLGGSPEKKPEAYRNASPLQLAHRQVPPTLLLHGGRDEMVWPKQAERLSQRLTELGCAHLFIPLPWADHGFDANLWGPSGQIYLYALERFLLALTMERT